MHVICDIETDALDNPKNIWVIVCRDLNSGEVSVFDLPQTNPEPFRAFARGVTKWYGHNFLQFDCIHLRVLLGVDIPWTNVVDTLVVSRLLNYSIEGGHSLEAWGGRLGYPKSKFDDFSKWSPALRNRCIEDTLINKGLVDAFRPYLESPQWQRPLDIEHFTQSLGQVLHDNGFHFNYKQAAIYKKEIEETLRGFLSNLQKAFPPRAQLVREVTPIMTKGNTLNLKDFRWLKDPNSSEPIDLTSFVAEATFSLIQWEPFNPSSNKQVIDRMWESGWKPIEKTKGHLTCLKEKNWERLPHYLRYGWKISEENLATLPDTAPEASRKLAEWLLLKNRESTLTQWFDAYNPATERIHGNFQGIGGWSHRMAHNSPNMANCPSPNRRNGTPSPYGAKFRELWTVPPGKRLIGCDAQGIQLRVFAHYTNDPELIYTVTHGNSDNKDDIHYRNWRIIGDVCRTRDVAKTFTYAWLLGAGVRKIAEIFSCSVEEAVQVIERIYKEYPGYEYLRKEIIPRDARNGYFRGFDGRIVFCDSAHKMPAGYLQNGETVIMKLAAQIWTSELEMEKIKYKLVNFIHDEWQTEVDDDLDLCQYVSEVQANSIKLAGEQLGVRCPMAGSVKKPGFTWLDSH